MENAIKLLDNTISILNDVNDRDYNQNNYEKCISYYYTLMTNEHFGTSFKLAYGVRRLRNDEELFKKILSLIKYMVGNSHDIKKVAFKHNYPLGKFNKQDAINRIEFVKKQLNNYEKDNRIVR